jgi:DNA polymerase
MPADLKQAIDDPDVLFVFQNSMFDRTVLRLSGLADIPVQRIHDTMIQALAHSLPGGLGLLCEIMGVADEEAKDKDGKKLIYLFCKPRPKNSKLRRATYETHPEEWQKFRDYAGNDITSMRAIFYKIPSWNYREGELELWRLDQRINDRGFAVDRDLARAAIEAIAEAQTRLARDTHEATYGIVGRATQRDRLLKFITRIYNVDLPDLQKSTLERRVNDPDLPQEVRELLAIRLEASKSSTSKYTSLLKAVSDDGRLRGTLQFCGASRTGRWSGRTFQPQNLFRPTMSQGEIDAMIAALKTGTVDMVTDKVMDVCANAIRGCIIAPEGKKLVVSDLSNIEGRFAAWVSEEEWKCEAFAEFDKGVGEDLYKVAYGKAFGVDPSTATGSKRQIGKVMELMLQYGGGVGAFLTGAATYGIDLDEMAIAALPSIPEPIRLEALAWYHKCLETERSTFDLSQETFVVCDSLKRMWREAHPQISSIWRELEDAIRAAINTPDKTFTVRKLKIRKDGSWLRIVLPSDRALCYPAARVNDDDEIEYKGMNPYSRKWGWVKSYGGKFFENCLGADTKILTPKGWKDIVEVTRHDTLWDGENWVKHSGLVSQGVRKVIDFGGVKITPEHKVLIEGDWVEAIKTNYEEAASSFARYNRANFGLLNCDRVRRNRWAEILLVNRMFLRGTDTYGGLGVFKESTEILRMYEKTANWAGHYKTWQERTSRVRGVSIDVGALPQPEPQSILSLWGQRYNSVLEVVRGISSFLGRYGANLRNGFDFGTLGQRGGIFSPELCMGYPNSASQKYTGEQSYKHPGGVDAFMEGLRGFGDKQNNTAVQGRSPMAGDEDVRTSEVFQQVYDLMDAGPNNRFTICGGDGRPFIVHNCCQAGSRDVMGFAMPLAESAGYETILTVHDELITETPDTQEFSEKGLSGILATNPPWAEGLPLAAGGFEATRYRKE